MFSTEPSPRVDAGVHIALRIGQRVRHRDYEGQRVTGTVRGLSIDSESTLQVDIVLDAPIVIPARGEGDRDISIWHQHVPAHELVPFDDRDELIAAALEALRDLLATYGNLKPKSEPEDETATRARAVLAKVAGGAA